MNGAEPDPISAAPALAYTVEQAAERVNIPQTKLWRAIRDNQLRSFKVGRSRRVSEQALRDFILWLETLESKLQAARDVQCQRGVRAAGE